MNPTRGVASAWYFSVPDTILWALMFVLLAYGLLSLALRDENIVMRTLRLAGSPLLVPLGALAPALLPRAVVALYAIACLWVIRVVLFLLAQALR